MHVWCGLSRMVPSRNGRSDASRSFQAQFRLSAAGAEDDEEKKREGSAFSVRKAVRRIVSSDSIGLKPNPLKAGGRLAQRPNSPKQVQAVQAQQPTSLPGRVKRHPSLLRRSSSLRGWGELRDPKYWDRATAIETVSRC